MMGKGKRARRNAKRDEAARATKLTGIEVSFVEDLSEEDLRWAESIDTIVRCGIAEARKRVRRWRHDPKILASLRTIASRLGPKVIVTNIQWSGPAMTDLTVTIAPVPAGTVFSLELPDGRTIVDTVGSVEQARKQMREAVADFELEVFGLGKRRTSIVNLGLVDPWKGTVK